MARIAALTTAARSVTRSLRLHAAKTSPASATPARACHNPEGLAGPPARKPQPGDGRNGHDPRRDQPYSAPPEQRHPDRRDQQHQAACKLETLDALSEQCHFRRLALVAIVEQVGDGLAELFVPAFADVVVPHVAGLVDHVGPGPVGGRARLPRMEVPLVGVERNRPGHSEVEKSLLDIGDIGLVVELGGVYADDLETPVTELFVVRLVVRDAGLAVATTEGPHLDHHDLSVEFVE